MSNLQSMRQFSKKETLQPSQDAGFLVDVKFGQQARPNQVAELAAASGS